MLQTGKCCHVLVWLLSNHRMAQWWQELGSWREEGYFLIGASGNPVSRRQPGIVFGRKQGKEELSRERRLLSKCKGQGVNGQFIWPDPTGGAVGN